MFPSLGGNHLTNELKQLLSPTLTHYYESKHVRIQLCAPHCGCGARMGDGRSIFMGRCDSHFHLPSLPIPPPNITSLVTIRMSAKPPTTRPNEQLN